MTEPTDDELDAVIAEYRTRIYPQDMHPRFERAIMRAAIAKWGALRAENIVIPTDTMEQEFQKHYQRGYEAGQKAVTPPPTQAQAGAVPTREFLERTLAAMEGVIDVADRKTDEFDALRSCVIDLTLMLFSNAKRHTKEAGHEC